jgi:hypothetical protein
MIMATVKKALYINTELEWAEQKLIEWKEFIDKNPICDLKDRIEWKPTKGGGSMPMVVASIESQIKAIRDTMKDFLLLLDDVNKKRQDEEYKTKDAKGTASVPHRMNKK